MPLSNEQKQLIKTALAFIAKDRDMIACGRSSADEAASLRKEAERYRELVREIDQL